MNKKHALTLFLLTAMLGADCGTASAGVSGSTVRLLLEDRTASAQVNGAAEPLETPAVIENGSFFIPVRWVADKLGLETKWNPERRTAGLTGPRAYLEWDLAAGTVSANGETVPFADAAIIRDGTLLAKLSWIAPYLNITYAFQPDPGRITLTYVQPVDTAYRESAYPEDNQPNSRPIAKFMTDKAVYRIGEPVEYIDLSYDPDAEGLPQYEWSGKQDAFFKPGIYPVTLRVRDGKGNWSRPFTQTVTVNGETLFTPFEYSWYYQPVGRTVKGTEQEWQSLLAQASEPALVEPKADDRLRLVSGEDHTILSAGLLGQYRIGGAGKARLYSQHVNGMRQSAQFAAVIRNPSDSGKLTVRITRESRTAPTLFYRQTGVQAAIDFLESGAAERTVTIGPGQSEALERIAMEPGQGFASMADIETDGAAEIGFVVAQEGEELKPLQSYAPAGAVPSGSGKSVYSDLHLEASAGAQPKLAKWTLGPRASSGTDSAADAGVVSSIRLYYPGRAAIAVRAKEGHADGALRVNGSLVPFPQGGITDQDGALLVYRSDGSKPELDIEWLAAPGSGKLIECIYYPLTSKD